MEHYGFGDMDRNTRASLLNVLEHRTEVDEFLGNLLNENVRMRTVNHPQVVWARFKQKQKAVEREASGEPQRLSWKRRFIEADPDERAKMVIELIGAEEAKTMFWAGTDLLLDREEARKRRLAAERRAATEDPKPMVSH
jgi:hypothetical protein